MQPGAGRGDGLPAAHPHRNAYLDAPSPTSDGWEIEEREAYLALKNELGIEGDLFGVEVIVLPEERILACAGEALHGEIDIEALNAGREVIVVAPDTLYRQHWETPEGGTASITSEQPFAELEPGAQYREFANDTFQVRQKLPLCQLFAREYQPNRADPSVTAADLERRDASPTIGATVDWATASNMVILSGCGYGDVITTHAGLQALGLFANGYSEFGVALAQTPPAETEAQIDAALREIASRVEGARYDSQFAFLREQRDTTRNLLLAAGTVLLLFTAIALSMMDNALSGRIRADRRTIGTLASRGRAAFRHPGPVPAAGGHPAGRGRAGRVRPQHGAASGAVPVRIFPQYRLCCPARLGPARAACRPTRPSSFSHAP